MSYIALALGIGGTGKGNELIMSCLDLYVMGRGGDGWFCLTFVFYTPIHGMIDRGLVPGDGLDISGVGVGWMACTPPVNNFGGDC